MEIVYFIYFDWVEKLGVFFSLHFMSFNKLDIIIYVYYRAMKYFLMYWIKMYLDDLAR